MTIRVPEISMSLLSASQKVPNEIQKILFIGQMTSAGSASSFKLYENIDNENSQDALFGKNSMIATMIRAAKVHNKISRIDAIPIDDNSSGVQAEGTISFTGPATGSGTITVAIGSKGNISILRHVYEINILDTETESLIADALADAINDDATAPVTAVSAVGVVTLTAVNAGTEGNFITNEITGSAPGIAYTMSGMSGGVIDPTLSGIFDVVSDIRYQTLVYPSYVRSEAKTFLDSRFNTDKNILDGVGIDCVTDVPENIVSLANALNSQSIAIIANKEINTPTSSFYDGSGIFEINTIIASEVAAIRALRLSDGASIGQYISATYGSKDAFGGPHIASLPYFNTILPYLPIEETGKIFSNTDIVNLNNAGVTVIGNNIAKNNIIMGTTTTTYKTNAAGDLDVSFKFLEYVDTQVTCREYFYNNLRSRFSQSRLTNGNIKIGYNMANEAVISSFITGLYNDLANIALTKVGTDPDTGINWLAYFKDNLNITLDLSLGKVTISMQLPIVTQLRVMIVAMQVSFSANS